MARRRRSQQPIMQSQSTGMMQGQATGLQGQSISQNQPYGMQGQSNVQSQAYGVQDYSMNQNQAYGMQGQSNVQSQQSGTYGQSISQNQQYGTQGQSISQNQAYGSQGQSISQNQQYGIQGQSNVQGQPTGTMQPSYLQPDFSNQQTQAFIPQARNDSYMNQSYQGGMPAPGSSGDMSAPYGERNTGINHADARNVGFQGGYTGYGSNGQPTQYGTFMRDGTQYGVGPHTIDPNKAMIQAVHYGDGGIAAVQFQDGRVVDIANAIGMAEAGLIEDVNTGRNREGEKTLRSYPDGDPSNNLSNLPRF